MLRRLYLAMPHLCIYAFMLHQVFVLACLYHCSFLKQGIEKSGSLCEKNVGKSSGKCCRVS